MSESKDTKKKSYLVPILVLILCGTALVTGVAYKLINAATPTAEVPGSKPVGTPGQGLYNMQMLYDTREPDEYKRLLGYYGGMASGVELEGVTGIAQFYWDIIPNEPNDPCSATTPCSCVLVWFPEGNDRNKWGKYCFNEGRNEWVQVDSPKYRSLRMLHLVTENLDKMVAGFY